MRSHPAKELQAVESRKVDIHNGQGGDGKDFLVCKGRLVLEIVDCLEPVAHELGVTIGAGILQCAAQQKCFVGIIFQNQYGFAGGHAGIGDIFLTVSRALTE